MAKLDLDTLIDQGKPVYVVNNTNPRGRLVISIVHPTTGKVTPIDIPVTWVPICVTDIIPREQLRDSIDFRGYLVKGVVKLIDPDKAEKILNTKEAAEEIARINQSDYADQTLSEPHPVTAGDEGQIEEVNPRVMDIILRLESKDLNVNDALNKLKALYGTMTKQDLSYIVTNAGSSPTIRSWAEKMLTKMESSDE